MAPPGKGRLSQEEKGLLEAIGKEALWELPERENEGRQGQRRKRRKRGEEAEEKEESSQKCVLQKHQEEEEPSNLIPEVSGSSGITLEEEIRHLQNQNEQLTAKVAAFEKWAEGYIEHFIPLHVQVTALERRSIEEDHRIWALEEDPSTFTHQDFRRVALPSLPEEARDYFMQTKSGNTEEATRLLGNKNVHINCLDEHGMTPLMHAAYKGKVDICKLLLRHGADVNCNEHEHGYTALMFAGLSGNKEITWMMLEAGADTDAVNSVGRTAAQMAAFVGQHDCVTVINNFFPRERLDYYTKPQGLDKEPKLPVKLAGPLHKIITTTNLHPVKIMLLVKENPLLVEAEAMQKCYKVLDLICEKCMKQRDMNEVLAMKMHYISCILQKCIFFLKEREDKLDGFIKSLLKGRDTDGFPVYQEKFIRECIRKFPYCEATLLQQLVRSVAPVEIGSEPTAFSVLTQAITGQVGFVDAEFCTTCGEKGAAKRCSVCKMVIYCNQNCQKMHWFTHKKSCKTLKEIHEKQELEAAKKKKKEEQEKEAAQAADLRSEEKQVSESEGNKEVELKYTDDITEKMIPNNEMPVPSPQDDNTVLRETSLTDINIEKVHKSEE